MRHSSSVRGQGQHSGYHGRTEEGVEERRDMIPWIVSTQNGEPSFGDMSGVRILGLRYALITLMGDGKAEPLGVTEVSYLLNPYDLKRLESYANNMLDYHVILDLLPTLATLHLTDRFSAPPPLPAAAASSPPTESKELTLSAVQGSILLALGCQRKRVEYVESEFNLPISQTLALLVKVMRKVSKALNVIRREDVQASLPPPSSLSTSRVQIRENVGDGGDGEMIRELEDELDEAGEEVLREKREQQREMINSLDLKPYAIDSNDADWSHAELQVKSGKGSHLVSVKSNEKKRKISEEDRDAAVAGGKDKKKTRRSKSAFKGKP